MLECEGGVLYTGIARDVEARFEAHLKGARGARYAGLGAFIASLSPPRKRKRSEPDYEFGL